MKSVILSNSTYNAKRVYVDRIVEDIKAKYDLADGYFDKTALMTYSQRGEIEAIFSTWGMPQFTVEEIKANFPKLKYVFYAAGTVQGFAKEFLDMGVRVFSAWKANAIPVAEFTFAQIILAQKGFFKAAKRSCSFLGGVTFSQKFTGNYKSKIGLLGAGGVGSLVAERLKTVDCEVFCFDPFMSDERAESLNLQKKSMEWIFANCNVVSNHLANKKELDKVITYELLSSMQKYSVFINTGRGAQVDEKALAKALRRDKSKYAILDVTRQEPLSPFNRLRFVRNKVITPHIAGSMGGEVVRMGALMVETASKINAGERVDNEVSQEMLATMA